MTPSERLQAIIDNVVPGKGRLVFKSAIDDLAYFSVEKTVPLTMRPSNDKLQELLAPLFRDVWDPNTLKFQVSIEVDELFKHIKNRVLTEYTRTSARSVATKRKSEIFLSSIPLTDNLLANFLISAYIEVNSESWVKNKTLAAKQEYFEVVEGLRKVYGSK